MAHLYLTRTIHMPVTADGKLIKNSFGVVIAEVKGTTVDADALAQIINLGFAAAQEKDDEYNRQQDKIAGMIFGKEKNNG